MLRERLYTESRAFVSGPHPEVKEVLSSDHPSDPLGLETTALPSENAEVDMQLCNPPRERWSSRVPLIFASYCNTLTRGGITAITLILLNDVNDHRPLFLQYSISLILFVIPVLALEYSLGQMWQGGVMKVYAMVSKRTKALGLVCISLLTFFSILQAYELGQTLLYMIASFRRVSQWAITPEMRRTCYSEFAGTCDSNSYCMSCVNVDGCFPAFFKHAKIIYGRRFYSLGNSNPGLVVGVYVCIVIGTVIAGLLTLPGLVLLGQVAVYAGLSSLILFGFLAIYSHSLDTACDVSSLGELFNLDYVAAVEWRLGIHQVFNLLTTPFGLILGTQYTLASFRPISENNLITAVIVIGCRTLTAILSAIFVIQLKCHTIAQGAIAADTEAYREIVFKKFSSLANHNDWCSDQRHPHSIGLRDTHRMLFEELPVSLATLPGSVFYSILMYSTFSLAALVTLSISILSIVKTIEDTSRFSHYPRSKILGALVVFIIVGALPFSVNFPAAGYYGIDITFYADTMIRAVTGILGVLQIYTLLIAPRWKEITKANEDRWRLGFTAMLIISTVSFMLIWEPSLYSKGINLINGVPIVITGCIIIFIITFFIYKLIRPLSPTQDQTYLKRLIKSLFGDIEFLRHKINKTVTGPYVKYCRLGVGWSFCIKFASPVVLMTAAVGISYDETIRKTNVFYWPFVGLFILFGIVMCWAGFTTHFDWILPTKANTWSWANIPVQHRKPRFILQRKPFRFWEEFIPPEDVFQAAGEVEVKHLRKIDDN